MLMFAFPVAHLERVIGTHNVMAAPAVIAAAENCKQKDLLNFMGNSVNTANLFHACDAARTVLNKELISSKRGKKFRRCPPPPRLLLLLLLRTAAAQTRIAGRTFDGFLICAPATGRWGRLTSVIPTVDLNQRRNLHLNPPPPPPPPPRQPRESRPTCPRTHSV